MCGKLQKSWVHRMANANFNSYPTWSADLGWSLFYMGKRTIWDYRSATHLRRLTQFLTVKTPKTYLTKLVYFFFSLFLSHWIMEQTKLSTCTWVKWLHLFGMHNNLQFILCSANILETLISHGCTLCLDMWFCGRNLTIAAAEPWSELQRQENFSEDEKSETLNWVQLVHKATCSCL